MRTVPVRLTREQALREAKEQLEGYESALPDGTKILSVETQDKTQDGELVVSSLLRCEENIARESEILIKS